MRVQTRTVVLQILSWGPLSAVSSRPLYALIALVLLGNLGASITEVAKDALVAEYGQNHGLNGRQSYAFMASAAGGIIRNFLAGYFLMKAPPRIMFLVFTLLLSMQLGFAIRTAEDSPTISGANLAGMPVFESFRRQLSELKTAIGDESVYRPLAWVVASVAVVPSLSGSIFCYQTRCLSLDPLVIGLSRVVGQLILLSVTVFYNCIGRKFPLRNLVGGVQILYACSVLLDVVLLKQINLKMGISNAALVLCFSSFGDIVAQFKPLPFSVLFASLCPRGYEASLMSFLASALCLYSIVNGVLGVGLSVLFRVKSKDYSHLPTAVLVQFLAALFPLFFLRNLPASRAGFVKDANRCFGKRPWGNMSVEKGGF